MSPNADLRGDVRPVARLSDDDRPQIAPESRVTLAATERLGAGRLRRIVARQTTAVTLALALIVVGFVIVDGSAFASGANLRNVATDASVVLILATAATFVIVSGGIDLSVGSVLVLCSVLSAKMMLLVGGQGWTTVLAGLLAAVAAGFACGLINGWLIAVLRLNPLIVTLATLGIALGAAQLVTNAIDITQIPVKAADLGSGRILQVPSVVLVALVISAIGGFYLRFTLFGRRTYAIGSNHEAARRAGIAVERHVLALYGLSGALAGAAGFLSLARFSSTTIGGHTLDNLNAITAVILGGTSLFGGVGTMLGSFVGTFIPTTLQNGFVIAGLPSYWQPVAVGVVLIISIYLDRLRRERSTNR